MVLGTLDRTPPPFFRQGPTALSKLVFFSALAAFLMIADTRFSFIHPLRAVLATVLNPIERVLMLPVDALGTASGYWQGLHSAEAAREKAEIQLAQQSERASRVDQLLAENARLRALLELRPALSVRSIPAEVLYEAPDPYSRKVVVDRGTTHGVVLGAPVINDAGVLGQVTRAYPLTSEVTLLLDKDAAIPLLNPRTQQRSSAFGTGSALELRFVASNADVQVDDQLITSGIDGIYPAGLQVARVASVERRADSGFAHIMLKPTASADGVRHVLLLEPLNVQMPVRPEPEDKPADKQAERNKPKGPRK